MNNTTNSWEKGSIEEKLWTLLTEIDFDVRAGRNIEKLIALLHDTEIAAYQRGKELRGKEWKQDVEEIRKEAREEIKKEIEAYFKGLIAIPDPQATLKSLLSTLTKE